MDRTIVCGTVNLGSIPNGSTDCYDMFELKNPKGF